MNTRAILGNVLVYGASHALVDATCAATLFATVAFDPDDPQALFQRVVLYGVLAFATQPLFGLWVDRFGGAVQSATSGVLLVAVATLLLPVPWLATLVTSIGNALFHVGGGVTSLNLAPGKAALPGIYVAPGALGLMVGTLIGKGGHFTAWPFILLLVGSAVAMVSMPSPRTGAHRKLAGDWRWFETVILLLFLSISIRGIVGLSLVLPWKSDPTLLVALTSAVVLGKAMGGILGDRFGWTRVALLGLALSAPLLAFFAQFPAVAIVGAFLFNLTMPITLVCLADMLPGKSGFAFGLTTLALIIGAGPTFSQLRAFTGQQAFIFAVILVSIAALYGGLKLYAGHFAGQASRQ